MAATNDIEEALKPFHQRAIEAEERLTRLEGVFAKTKVSGNEEVSDKVVELERMLEDAKSERLAEMEKASKELQRVTEENARLRYRINHLVRALEDADRDRDLK